LYYKKILVSGILISVFALIIFLNNQVEIKGSSDPGQTAFSQSKGGFLLYNNTDFGFQLLYPRDWGIVEGDHKPGDFVTDIVTLEPLSEQGQHFTKIFVCGEVCLYILVDNSGLGGTSLQQFSDSTYNKFKKAKGFDLLDYNSVSKLGNKKAFEIFFQLKQGNRDYTEKLIGTAFPPENADDSKSYLV